MRLILTLVFLFCSLEDAAALQKANGQDYRDITAKLKLKKDAEDDILRENSALDDARGNEVEELRIRIEIVRLEKVKKNAAEQALWLTIRAYDIIPFADNVPILDTGKSVLASREHGKDISWLPIFDEAGPQPDQDKTGKYKGIRIISPRVAGNTASDGISRIFPGTFSSPEELASIIIHEQRHFIQNTTPGKSDKMTTAELEVEAYEEELRLMDVLGFAGETRRLQEQRLTEILDGKKGGKGKKAEIGMRKLAKKQRSKANLFNGGLPFPERSLASHSEDDIKRLVAEAKKQIAIAQLDHDNRLRLAVIALSYRSCANPGSVTRAELLELPRPHYYRYWTVGGPDRCIYEYQYIAEGGTDPTELRSISTPPPNGLIPPSPAPVIGVSPPIFSSIYPQIKEFAIAACRGSNIPPIYPFFRTYFIYDPHQDDILARQLMAGQDNCSRQLFSAIVARTRAGRGEFSLTWDWVQEVVAANPPERRQNPGHAQPPSGGNPPGGGRPPPDRKHPDIVFPKPPWEKNIVDVKKTKHEK